jgi:hypothetical protein
MTVEQDRFQAPGYRTDGEIIREIGELGTYLEAQFLTDAQRDRAEQRLSALKAEQEQRRNARNGQGT